MELIISLAIIGILGAISIPAYQNFIEASRRSDAMNTLLDIQLEQERWRTNNAEYGALSDIWVGSDSTEGYYTMAVLERTASTYTITATPKTGTPQESDRCGVFAINHDGPLHGPSDGYADEACWRN